MVRWVRSSNHRRTAGETGAGADAARVERTLEHGDVVGEEPLRPRVPLRVGDADPLVGPDLELVVLGPAGRREVRVADAAVAADGDRVDALPGAAPASPGHPPVAPVQRGAPGPGAPCARRASRPNSGWTASGSAVPGQPHRGGERCRVPSRSGSATSRPPSTRSNSGSSPAHVAATHPSATRPSTTGGPSCSRGARSLERHERQAILRGRALQGDAAGERPDRPVGREVGNGTFTTRAGGLRPNERCSPVTSRASCRRPSDSARGDQRAVAVGATRRRGGGGRSSPAPACVAIAAGQNVPRRLMM